FTAQMAFDMGLIDEIGYWEDAAKATARALDVEQVKIFRYEERFSFSSFLKGSGGLTPEALMRNLARPKLLYYWQY
ncbi:MAG: hypothetical protein O3C57_01180, partial [Verrucomicrobia bacterium]|nr:hypothetical protein [Verrucomicrobiota bacterium]